MQISVTPQGERFFCYATTVTLPMQEPPAFANRYVLSMGCSLEDAPQLAYYEDFTRSPLSDKAYPIGSQCIDCPHTQCHERIMAHRHVVHAE